MLEPLSLDEAYLDVTENKTGLPTATLVARTIREQIREELNLTASAGVAPNTWAVDSACDALATGRGIRILAIVDTFTRECLTLEVDTSLSSQRVTRALEQAIRGRDGQCRTGTWRVSMGDCEMSV